MSCEASKPEAPPSRRSRLKAFADRFWKRLVAVVGLLVGITALLAYFGIGPPAPSPDPTPTPSPDTTGAEIEVTGMVPNRTLRRHLEDVGLPTDGFTPAELRRIGNVFDVEVVIRGYKDQQVPLRWTMFDAVANTELTGDEFVDQESDRFTPRSQEDSGTARVWTPIPREQGTYEIELVLVAPGGGVLDRARGPDFETTGA